MQNMTVKRQNNENQSSVDPRRLHTLAAIPLALLIALAGCSSDSGSGSDSMQTPGGQTNGDVNDINSGAAGGTDDSSGSGEPSGVDDSNTGDTTGQGECLSCLASGGFISYGWPELNIDSSPLAFNMGVFETNTLPAIVPDYTGDTLAEIFTGDNAVLAGRNDLSSTGDELLLELDPRLIPLTVLNFTGDSVPDRVSRNLPRAADEGIPYSGFELRFTPGSADEEYQPLNGSNGIRVIGIEPGHMGVRTAIGDINGDGFEDLALSPDGVVTDAGRAVHILFGRSSFPQGEYQLSQLVPDYAQRVFLPEDLRSLRVIGLGDVNGDGFNDFSISGSTRNSFDTRRTNTYVVYGSAAGIAGGSDIQDVEEATQAGHLSTLNDVNFLAPVGDIDADGTNDVAIRNYDDVLGELQLLRMQNLPAGSTFDAGQLDSWITRIMADGSLIARPAGDMDGDGFDDMLLIELVGDASAIVYGGSLAGVTEIRDENLPTSHIRLITTNTPNIVLTDSGNNRVLLGYGTDRAVGVGDVDGDGYDDVVLKAPRYRYEDLVDSLEPGMNPTSLGADVYVVRGGPRS